MIEEVHKPKGKGVSIDEAALEEGAIMTTFAAIVELVAIELGDDGLIESAIIRVDEEPPSAAWHLRLDRKEYMLILQPTDLPSIR